MCGFAAVVAKRPEGLPGEDRLRRMNKVLEHRGPDDSGTVVEGPVAMTHRRLAVIDLEGGRQPMSDPEGAVTVVYNGEIYNFRELTRELEAEGQRLSGHSDTEVLLAAYRQWGRECLDRLNGMFAFVVHDRRDGTVFAARDRFGEKPLYVCETADAVYLASELKALLAAGVVEKRLDPVALYQYFTLGYVAGCRTIFAGVKRLGAGQALDIGKGSVRTWTYWEPPGQTSEIVDFEEASRAAFDLLRDSVRMRLVSDVPLGLFLSGGIDSTAVVAAAHEVTDARLDTFAVGFAQSDYDERPFAREAARRFGTRHHEYLLEPKGIGVIDELVWHLDEPFADSSALPTYFLSRFTRDHVTVALSGDGGDEVFAGYDVYRGHVLSERVRRVPGLVRDLAALTLDALSRSDKGRREHWERRARNVRDAGLPAARRFLTKQQMVFRGPVLAGLARGGFAEKGRAAERSDLDRFFPADHDALEGIAAWQAGVSLVDDMLVKVDRMSMAHSLEVRAPFLDPRLIELTRRIPFSVKMRGGRTKAILKHSLERYFPVDFVHRPKKGFAVPLNHWFRGDLTGHARALLVQPGSMTGRLFREGVVAELLALHEGGRRNAGPALWALIVFEAWCRVHEIGAEALPLEDALAGSEV